MKKNLLIAIGILLSVAAFAQPANDNPSTATNVGTLPTPAACNGQIQDGAAVNATSGETTINATAGSPFVSIINCGGGTADMASPAKDVWFKFVATGTSINVNITPGSVPFLASPNIGLWYGTPSNLQPWGCGIGGASGSLVVSFPQTVPGQTYYLQVTGNSATATGNFQLAVDNDIDCNNCLRTATGTASPQPVNGEYQPGQVVNFCYHITAWSQQNTNWLHGVQVTWGAGWANAAGAPTSNSPAASLAGNGTWKWFPAGCTSSATGMIYGAGFYYDYALAPGSAGNNYGDYNSGNPVGNWNFCISLTVAAGYNPTSDLGVTFNTSGDGESGSWSSSACTGDPVYLFPAHGSTTAGVSISQTTGSNPSCIGSSVTYTAAAVNGGTAPSYQWMVDGVATGTNSSTYTTNSLTNSQTVSCVLTSSIVGIAGNPDTSNIITMLVDSIIPATPIITVQNNCGNSVLSTNATGILLWSTGQTTPSITLINADIVGVTQTLGSCTSAAGSNSAAPLSIPARPSITVTKNCGNSVLSTTSTDSLLWNTGQTTSSITVVTGGNYTITATNGSACSSSSASTAVTVNTIPPTPIITVQNNCGNSVLSTNANGALLWNTSETTASITVTSPGTNTVTQTVNGCTSSTSSGVAAPLTIPPSPSITLQNNCGSSVLSTTAAGTLLWNTGEITSSITVTSLGTNTVTQTVNGCTSAAGNGIAAPFSVPATPIVTVQNNCGNSVLSTTSVDTILWSTGETTASITVTSSGNYSVTVTNPYNCIASSGPIAVTIGSTAPPTPTVTVQNNCGSSVLSTTANDALQWSTGETTSSITVTSPGTNTVTQTVNGCTSAAGSGIAAPFSVPATPIVTVQNNCGNSVLSTTSVDTILWSTGETTASITVTSSGNYSITVTNPYNCIASSVPIAVTIGGTGPPTPTVTVQNNCGSSVLSTTAAGTLLWNTGETTSSITVTSPGTNTVTQTVNGCTSAAGSGIAAPFSVPATPVVTVTNNCGNSVLTTTATDTILWSTGETTASITVTSSGNYSVTVTNPYNCIASSVPIAVTIGGTAPPTPIVTVQNNCGSSVLSTTASGALLWNTGETTSSITVTSPGTNRVTQTVNGCRSAAGSAIAIPLTVPPAPLVTGQNNCGNSVLSAIGTNLLWSTGETAASITVTSAGINSVTQTVAGCTSAAASGFSAPLTVPVIPTITQNGGVLTSSANAGNQWYLNSAISLGDSTQTDTTTQSGSYSVTVTESNGCSSSSLPFIINSTVWPGDANNDSLANNYDLLPIGLFYYQTGSPRSGISNAWQAYPASDWGTNETNGSDIKHADCNGDGVIDDNDTLAVNLNFSSAHAFTGPNSNLVRTSDPDLYFTTSNAVYLPGDYVSVDVMIGKSAIPAANIYGIAFNIGYDASLVVPGSETILYPNSWLGNPSGDAIKFAKIDAGINTAFAAETRIDHLNRNGYGKIATFSFQVSFAIASVTNMNFVFNSYSANDSVGNPISFNSSPHGVLIDPAATGISAQDNNSAIAIYPNPYSDYTTISYSLKSQSKVAIEIYNSLGEKVQQLANAIQIGGAHRYDFSAKQNGYAPGIYFVKINIDGITTMKRIVEIK
jgi:hypothetical protein